MAVARGAMIVFEGCDRCGKSTQCLKLVEYLRSIGRKVEMLRFPDRSTAIGNTIDSYLQGKSELDDHAIHLMFSANRWEMKSRMKRLLEEGTTLIVDRYAFSGVAFTAAKHNFDLQWCKFPDSGLIAPDVVLYLDMPLEEASKRGQYGGERYERLEFQRKVSNVYSKLKEDNWKEHVLRCHSTPPPSLTCNAPIRIEPGVKHSTFLVIFDPQYARFPIAHGRQEMEDLNYTTDTFIYKVVNASQTIDDVHIDIKEIVENTISTARNSKLQTLWPLNQAQS